MIERIAGLALLTVVVLATAHVSQGAPRRGAKTQGQIVFWSDTPWPSIWAIRPDGSKLHRILRNRQNAKRPVLSPDRKWVAFDGAAPGKAPLSDFDIQIVHVDGTSRTTPTDSSEWDLNAEWSPDGTVLAFTRMPPGAVWRSAWIWTVRADGSAPTRLLKGQEARWSPDGKRLVFDAPTGVSDGDLFTAYADGSDLRRLTATRAYESAAGWSPDGSQILFTRSPGSGIGTVYAMSANGGKPRRLASGFAGSWSPDGTKIVYISPSSQLFVMNANGSKKRRIARVKALDPSWR
jgi:TolB protein